MKRLGFIFKSFAILATIVTFSSAQAQEACGTYTVKTDDTLGDIAWSAYGSGDYQMLFDANRDRLGGNPAALEVGLQLQIPCPDGALIVAQSPQSGGQPGSQEPVETASAARLRLPGDDRVAALGGSDAPTADTAILQEAPITLLTGDGYAPFAGRDLPEGGMFPDLIRRAAGHSASPVPYEIHVVPDWRLHLTQLLPDGVYDMGFPWFKPDCAQIDRLSRFMADRCRTYSFSEPFYEAIIGYYTRSEGPFSHARQHSDLAGARLCRPYGYFRFDLDAKGLKPPTVEVVQPATLGECFQALADGRVDVVSIGVSDAAGVIQRLGLRRNVRELARLATVQSLHVMVPRQNPRGGRGLAMLDDGITQMRQSGEWYRVVSRHMNDFARRTAQR